MPPRASWLQGSVRRHAPSYSSSGFPSLAVLAPRAFPRCLPSLLLTPSSTLLSMIGPPPSSGEVGDWGRDYDQSFQERVIARRASPKRARSTASAAAPARRTTA